MLLCSSCGNAPDCLGFCPACSELFCQSCSGAEGRSCPRCAATLCEVKVIEEKLPGVMIDWVLVNGETSARIGFYGYTEIPSYIRLDTQLKSPIERVLFCQGTEEMVSVSTALSASPEYGNCLIPGPAQKPLPGSRYRVVHNWSESGCTVLFNGPTLSQGDIDSILSYLAEYQTRWSSYGHLDSPVFRRAVAECEGAIQRSTGAPFYVATDFLKRACQAMPLFLAQSWVEYESLSALIHTTEPSHASRFIKSKFSLLREIFSAVKGDCRDNETFYSYIPLYLKAGAMCMSLPEANGFRRSYLQQLERLHIELKERARAAGAPSIANVLDILHTTLTSSETYRNWDTYQETVAEGVVGASRVLKPEFPDATSSEALMQMGFAICQELETNVGPVPDNVTDFIMMCGDIASAEDAQGMLALTASRFKLIVLESLGYRLADPILCPVVESTARDNLLRFENRVCDIASEYPEIPMDAGDLILDINGAISFCTFYSDFAAVKRLRVLIDERSDKEWAKTAVAFLSWTDFTSYEDYEALRRFVRLLPEVRSTHIPQNVEMEPLLDIMERVADAVLASDKRYENLAKAQIDAQALIPSPMTWMKEQMQYETLYTILDTYPFLFRAADAPGLNLLASNLHNAVEACRIFCILERPETPQFLFFLKTVLLESMAIGDVDEVRRIVKEIRSHRYSSPTSEQLANIASKWIDVRCGAPDSLVRALEPCRYAPSPWVNIALVLLSKDAKAAYQQIIGIIGAGDRVAVKEDHEGFWKGTALELAMHLCYIKDGFEVDRRVRVDQREKVDLLCYRREDGLCRVHFVDVKMTKSRYGPENAQAFLTRVKWLKDHLRDYIPSDEKQEWEISLVIASMGGITRGAREELSEVLPSSRIIVLTGTELVRYLETRDISYPSFGAQ